MAENKDYKAKMGGPGRGPGHGPGRGPIGAPPEKAKDFKGTVGKLMQYLGGYKVGIIFALAFAFIAMIFSVNGPKVMSKATDELVNGLTGKIQGTGGIDFSYIGYILIMTLIIYAVSALLTFLMGFIMSTITQKTCYKLRRDLTAKINRMPVSYFEKRTVGEVLSRITNDIDTLGNGLNQSITQLFTSITTMIGVAVMMFTINVVMALITICIVPISLFLLAVIIKKSQKFFMRQQEYLGHINGQVEETYGGHTVVKAFGKEKDVNKVFDETNNTLYDSAWKSQFMSGMMMPVMMFVGNLGYVCVVVAGAFFAMGGAVTIGGIQAFIQYVKNFTQPLQQIAQVITMLQSMIAAAERVFEFLAEEEEDQTVKDPAPIENVKGDVEFNHISFGYTPEKLVIKEFNQKVDAGKQIAIVGPTGAGKTTIVKLLMRFYDVNSGEILVDGRNVKDYNRGELREAFGMVLQDTWLFKGTVMENIRYGRLSATDEEVYEAAKAAHVHHFIKTLPGGYNMEINEEASNISQGQKQLITIARAILANNPIMILDEATSSVDTRTEHLIQSAMDNLMKGRTSFVIAHRLSTIKNADVILVMKEGDVVEQGTHEELLAKGGFYADLYNSQFEEVPA